MDDKEIREAAEQIFSVMRERVSESEIVRLRDAFEFAKKAHKTQKRRSGEPYIIHPIAVAKIVAVELELDTDTVIAAFLHDVVEDTPVKVEEIRSRFGDDVAYLVDVVTKKKKEKYENTKQVDNFKQILESVNFDIRALMVKLSDRLHNMRTLNSMTSAKQMKIAGETDFFYAPLAGRLGLYHVKSELENLSFQYRCPAEYNQLLVQQEQDRVESLEDVTIFTDKIESILAEENIKAYTQVRYRKPYSVWRNMVEAETDFSHVDFKHYVRVIYSPVEGWSEKDVSLLIYSRLSSHFKERPGSVVNYIDNPKDNGYQSFHVKFLNQKGIWEELHISSERMVRNSKLGCIVERGESWLGRFTHVLQEIAMNSNVIFMDSVRSMLYNEDIVAFTPRGKGVILPKDSTALDFAYELHSDIGEHAKYCRINNVLSPLKTVLHRGDCVFIGTDQSSFPTSEWLEYVKTYRARRFIEDYLKRLPNAKYLRCKSCSPLPGDEVIGFKHPDGKIEIHSKHCPLLIRLASENGDAITDVDFEENESISYPVSLEILAIDRFHLLQDIINTLVDSQHHSLDSLETKCDENIVTVVVGFKVHSANELVTAKLLISEISGVETVR